MRFLPTVRGSGIPQTEGATRGLFRLKWYEAITGMFAAALFTIFMGLSAGSEGPSIMIGGACGSLTSDALRRNAVVRRYQITSGACAGISVAFNAPLTGMAFAFEEAHKRFTPEVFVCSFSSVVVALVVRNLLRPAMGFEVGAFLTAFSFEGVDPFHFMFLLYVLFSAVIVSLAGVAFYYLVFLCRKIFAKSRIAFFAKGLFRVSIPFVLAGAFGLITSYAMGGGHHFIEAVGSLGTLERIFSSPVWATLLIVVILRLITAVANMGAGVPAGAFVPILAIGAGMGALLSMLCGVMGMDPAYSDALILICMASFFTTVVKSPITGIVMVVELTWNFTFLLPVILGTAVGYVIGGIFRTEPIYDRLLEDFTEGEKEKRKITVRLPVCEGSLAAGRAVCDILWPLDSLITQVERGEETFRPDGNTRLVAGDLLVMECKTSNEEELNAIRRRSNERIRTGGAAPRQRGGGKAAPLARCGVRRGRCGKLRRGSARPLGRGRARSDRRGHRVALQYQPSVDRAARHGGAI